MAVTSEPRNLLALLKTTTENVAGSAGQDGCDLCLSEYLLEFYMTMKEIFAGFVGQDACDLCLPENLLNLQTTMEEYFAGSLPSPRGGGDGKRSLEVS